ncbi:MAG: 1,6-anhydro-N-acetylmuramyl-L-alanine amidase AmpD [Deltaproteobacteria bacterium]|nr:1,6-anhydro-N-acetylmuramyl-L-alanine amidase AmpD [Deltaproteobacteria bacterium]
MRIIRLQSPNYDSRAGQQVDAIVIHHISLPAGRFGTGYVADLFLNRLDQDLHPSFRDLAGLRVSSHYFIDRQGEVINFVDTSEAAWHAGDSSLEGREDVNLFSIGIELEGDAVHPFTAAQYNALVKLCIELMHRYPSIVPRRIVGHRDVAPGRKYDPGPAFDWEQLGKKLREKRLQNTSLEDRVGQMLMVGPGYPGNPGSFRKEIESLGLGFAILFQRDAPGAQEAALLCRELTAPMSGLPPLMVAVDQEGGRVMRIRQGLTPLPSPARLGMLGERETVTRVASIASRELAALGIFLNLAPVADLAGQPPCPAIGDRSFGAEPELVGNHAGIWVSESQAAGVASCLKHFPGHGSASGDSHLCLPRADKSLECLLAQDIHPFKRALSSSPAAVMTAHVVYPALDPDVPATFSRPIITGLLREQLGFGGLVITDDLEMAAVSNGWELEEAAVRAIEAGADVLLVGRHLGKTNPALVHRGVMKALDSGRLTPERVDASVLRIMAVKDRYAGPPIPGILRRQEDLALVDEVNKINQ